MIGVISILPYEIYFCKIIIDCSQTVEDAGPYEIKYSFLVGVTYEYW